jgi:WD40 repeat protein
MKKRIIIGIIVSISLLVLCYYQFSYKSQRVHDGVITLYHTVLAHTNQIWAVKFSPDNKTFATGGVDSSVKLWDNETAEMIKEYKMPSGITYLCFSPDGKYIACSAYDGIVRLLDLEKGAMIRSFTGHKGTVWSVAFSPDGQTLASAGEDRLIRIWSVNGAQPKAVLEGHERNIWCLDFNPDGSLLASGSFDGTARIWDVHNQRLLTIITGHTEAVVDLAFSHDGKMLATVGDDKSTQLWNTSSWTLTRRMDVAEHVQAVAFSSDDKRLLTGGRDKPMIGEFLQNFFGDSYVNKGVSARLWDVNSGKLIETFSEHRNDVNDVAFSPDDRYLATASSDKTVQLWKLGN